MKKIYNKFIFITDILYSFVLSYAMFTECNNIGISSMSSMPWFILGLLFFITAIRKFLKKQSFGELFRQLRTR